MGGNGHDRSVFSWQGRVLMEADVWNPDRPKQNPNIGPGYRRETEKY